MIWGWLIGGAAAVWGLTKIVSKSTASNKLEFTLTGRIQKVTFSKITIVLNAQVKNPSKETFRFRQPFVTLLYKKETIGLSNVTSKEYELKPYSEITVKDITVDIYLLKLSALAADVFKIFQTATGTITIDANALVPVITTLGDVSINYPQQIVL
jgi:hypothetical protein